MPLKVCASYMCVWLLKRGRVKHPRGIGKTALPPAAAASGRQGTEARAPGRCSAAGAHPRISALFPLVPKRGFARTESKSLPGGPLGSASPCRKKKRELVPLASYRNTGGYVSQGPTEATHLCAWQHRLLDPVCVQEPPQGTNPSLFPVHKMKVRGRLVSPRLSPGGDTVPAWG